MLQTSEDRAPTSCAEGVYLLPENSPHVCSLLLSSPAKMNTAGLCRMAIGGRGAKFSAKREQDGGYWARVGIIGESACCLHYAAGGITGTRARRGW